MLETAIQQVQKLLEGRKDILIVFPKDITGDAISSALALFLFLEKQNTLQQVPFNTTQGKPGRKKIDIVCDSFELPPTLKFLKNTEKIQNKLSDLHKFIITLNTQKTGAQELSYDFKDDKLNIYITPKQGSLTSEDIKTAQSDFKYDLIFTINAADLESLGQMYANNTNLFYKTPIINIDNQAANEQFGQINIIDMTKSSAAEVLFELLARWKEEYIDADIATALLTGIISQTKSFKADHIKPHTLAAAGKLITLGADREKIINNLYRTRTIPMLKLWGHALTHLQNDKNLKLVWSTLTRDDFVRCGAQENDLKDIIDELINNSPEAKIILLLHEHTDKQTTVIHGILNTDKNYNGKKMLAKYNPQSANNNTSFIIKEKSLKEAEEEVVSHLKTVLKLV